MKKLLAAVLIFFSASVFLHADQIERVIDFDAVMTLSKDNTALIEESISVYSNGDKIRRGIYRDIPKSFKDGIFTGYMRYSDISLERNGRKEPFFTENFAKKVRIYFGDDSFLDNGVQSYKLKYKADNVAGFYDDFDEVYWNVTGNNWEFVIENATFRLILPDDFGVIREAVSTYVGRAGEKGEPAYERSFLFFDSGGALHPGEGMTVAVPFKKGVIKEPSFFERAALAVSSNIYLLFPFMSAVLIITAYNVIIRVLSFPGAKNTFQQVFDPPSETDAAFAKYIWNMGSADPGDLISIYISGLLMNGSASIKKEKFYRYMLIPDPRAAENLPEEEKKIYKLVFLKDEALDLSQYNSDLATLAMVTLNHFKEKGKKYIKENKALSHASMAVFWLFLLSCGLMNGGLPVIMLIFISLFYMIFFGIGIVLGESTAATLKTRGVLRALFSGGFFTFWTGFTSVHSAFFILSGNLNPAAFIIYGVSAFALAVATAWFRISVRSFTQEGAALYGKLKSYRDFLLGRKTTFESLSINEAFGEFGKNMPYAIALGISDQWAKLFERQLKDAYNNGTMSSSGIDMFMKNGHFRTGALFLSIRPRIDPPEGRSGRGGSGGSRSSGSGGGGSSGGGRGGGGGGGR